MAQYSDSHGTARTLSDREVAALLKTTGERRLGFRDHCLFAFALATGLREGELLALNIGDVFAERGARRLLCLRSFKGSGRAGAELRRDQEVRLPDGLRSKLERLRSNMKRDGLPVGEGDPLFVSARRKRLSDRMARAAFAKWQIEAGFERRFTFHELRHTAVTTAYRRGGQDIELARRFARHRSIATTQRYTHASDQALEQLSAVMPC